MFAFLSIITIFLATVIYFVCEFIRRFLRTHKHLDTIPGPTPLPIIGNVFEVVGTQEYVWNNLRFLSRKYPIYRLWSPAYDTINIFHPDDVEKILSSSKNISKSIFYYFMQDWFGTGLLTSTGRKWQERRKILTPAFHFNVLREFADIFDKEGHHMVDELQLKNGAITINLVPFITKYTLNTICETAMGTSLSKIESSRKDFHNLYRKSVHQLGELIIHRNIIDERQKYHEDTQGVHLRSLNENNGNNDEMMRLQTSKKKLAMLDLLIAAMKNGHINKDGIQEEVDTFMFEQRVRHEVDEVLEKCKGRMGITELQQLPYLERCIKEALRLYPSVPTISREITEDIQLDKYLIPVGAVINVHIYDLHRDPNFWPDPLRYDPDRFLPERIQGRHPFSYVPFSAGPRNCIGQKFAMMELKAMVGHLIHNFYLEPVDLAKDISSPFIRRWQRIYKYLSKIPGPPVVPIIGNVLQFDGTQEQMWSKLRQLGKEYYPIYRLWNGSCGMVSIRHPDDVQKLLSSSTNNTKSYLYELLHDWFGTGLLTSEGKKWQHRRKILTKAFHFNALEQFAKVIDQKGHCMAHELMNKNGHITVDLIPFVSRHTLDTICETSMGISLSNINSSDDIQESTYRQAIHELTWILAYRLLRPWLYFDLIFPWTLAGRLYKKYLSIVRGFSKKIIEERQKYHEDTKGIHLECFDENNEDAEITNHQSLKKKLAMLDLLIAAKKNGHINDDGIWEEVDTFVFEGHDTTAMGLCFTLLLLAEHNDIQQRVRDEIDEALKKCEGHMGITELQQLPYLERCIKEALRLYPSVPTIVRDITEDVQLSNYFIPVGTAIVIHIYDLHRDPNFWPDPDRYDPDRFLPERIQGRHPFSYIPFSGGPRNCIGQKFAMMELKAMVGHLIHNFYLKPVDLANE
ncbi:hypothetical protein PV326_008408, partial [Microctonus aethiopoides]